MMLQQLLETTVFVRLFLIVFKNPNSHRLRSGSSSETSICVWMSKPAVREVFVEQISGPAPLSCLGNQSQALRAQTYKPTLFFNF